MKRIWMVTALAIGLAASAAWAQGMGMGMMDSRPAHPIRHAPAALTQYGCMACHAVASGKVGPAFAWVTWRYGGKADALRRISTFIAHGGSGPWGGVMPDLNVPPTQARRIARWILSLPPQAPPRSGAEGGRS